MDVDALDARISARWRGMLDHVEQARADRFRFARDCDTFVAAHALKRCLLSLVGDLPPSAWRFVAGQLGKPQLDPMLDRPRLRFNLSHSRGLVACAVGLDHDLGLDVETVEPRNDALSIAECVFAPSELALLRGAAPGERPDLFVRVWTLKEAYVKATGQGMASCALDGFAFAPSALRLERAAGDDPAGWQFAQWRPTVRHWLALAVRRPSTAPITLTKREVSPHEL